MFVKYNRVLRGLSSEAGVLADFLKNSMVTLCCPKAVADEYMAGSLSLEEAKRSLNRYTTTLLGINSSIIKIGKLTNATKIYRGFSGMTLPNAFWQSNEFDVCGGVEHAFMSTTPDIQVAMRYASSDLSKMGIVMEIQQDFVNRGADLSWLSQYPHEKVCSRLLVVSCSLLIQPFHPPQPSLQPCYRRAAAKLAASWWLTATYRTLTCAVGSSQDIVFGPLAAIEVLGTRMDGPVVIFETKVHTNHNSISIDKLIEKRSKELQALSDAMTAGIEFGDTGDTFPPGLRKEAADWFRELLEPVLSHSPKHYSKQATYEQAILDINRSRDLVVAKYQECHFTIKTGNGATIELRKLVSEFVEHEKGDRVEVVKFSSLQLKAGRPIDAALGVNRYLHVDDKTIWSGLSKGTAAIVAEFEANGTADDKECLKYVLYGTAGSSARKWEYAGNRQMDTFDDERTSDGRANQPLVYFVRHSQATQAGLLEEHVLALRLYTTAVYDAINDPLRGLGKRATGKFPICTCFSKENEPHPLPITVSYITDGIRRLRAVGANAKGASEPRDFWRGVRNVELPATFRADGGTEFAPMSTSSDINVALQYSSTAEKRLIFKVATTSFMDRGADLQFLSAFPGEIEFLYPPLTFLQPTGAEEIIKIYGAMDGAKPVEYTVIEVTPKM